MASPEEVVAIINKHYANFAAAVYNDVLAVSFQQQPAALRHASTLFFNTLISSQNGQDVVVPLPDDETDKITVGKYVFSKRHFARNYKRTFESSVIDHYKKLGFYVKVFQDENSLTIRLTPIRQMRFVNTAPQMVSVNNPVYASSRQTAPEPEHVPQPETEEAPAEAPAEAPVEEDQPPASYANVV